MATKAKKQREKKPFKEWWKGFIAQLRRGLSTLKTLTSMQLKEKMDLSFLRTTKKRIFHAVYFLLEFVGVGAICYLLFFACGTLRIFSINGDVPVSVIAIVFGFMMLLSVLFTTFGLVKSLYLSRDNLVLLTFPAKPSLIFLSKLCVYYVYEIRKNFLFLIPFFFAYGIFKLLPFWYYFWVLLLFLFISVVPVLLGALLSMPSLFIYQLCRKVRALQYVLTVVALALGAWGVLALISLIPENIDILASWGTIYWDIQDFLTGFEEGFVIVMGFTELIVGRSVGLTNVVFTRNTGTSFLILLGVIVAAIVLCFLLSQPLFYNMASKPFEYKKKVFDKEKPNKKTPVFLSAIRKECIVALRDNTILSLVVQLVVIMPISIELLNRLYAAMSTRVLGMQLSVAFNLLIVLLFLTSANVRIASAYSRDGSTAYLNKVQPSTFGKLLSSKLFINLVIGAAGVILTSAVFANYSGLSWWENILFALTAYAVYVCHLFWSAEMDIMNPQYTQYATFAEQSNNPNENKSTLLCFFLAFLMAIVLLLLSFEGMAVAWIKITAISLVLCAVKICTYFLKIKVFYKEK